MRNKIKQAISQICQDQFDYHDDFEVSRPDNKFGDYASNVAIKIAAKINENPATISKKLTEELKNQMPNDIKSIDIAGIGFININLSDKALFENANQVQSKKYEGKEIIAEFGDPNPFKEMHIGHLYTAIVGDGISRLFEAGGARVVKVSYHGDIGLHIAKAIWAIKKSMTDKNVSLSEIISDSHDLSKFYVEGNKAYESSEKNKQEIQEINKKIYTKADQQINEIYEKGKQISFAHFDEIYKKLNINFSKKYFESESAEYGLKIVKNNIGNVFTNSQNALVFKTNEKGLHTRVFINSEGLPTYEAKDLGLVELKNKDFPKADKSIIITDHQQADYFKVMLAALKKIDEKLAKKTIHLVHGQLSLSSGKMSSREGGGYSADKLIDELNLKIENVYPKTEVNSEILLGSLKYSFLKNRLGSDVVFDLDSSISVEGGSGPYLQYAFARAKSILAKVEENKQNIDDITVSTNEERNLINKLGEYAEVVEQATEELMPHYICSYLLELAQTFNRFYEKNRVIGDKRQNERLYFVRLYISKLKDGLNLLGIPAPDKM